MVNCHICGRAFGSASIDIHIPQCEKRWEATEAQKPQKERRPVPQRPELEPGMGIEQFNQRVLRQFNNDVLSPCPHCGRTFLPERLEVHLRSCRSDAPLTRPRGRSAGPASAVEQQEQQQPQQQQPRQQQGSPLQRVAPQQPEPQLVLQPPQQQSGPSSPEMVFKVVRQGGYYGTPQERQERGGGNTTPRRGGAAGGAREAVGSPQRPAMQSAAASKALTPCEHCGRTFLPDRLEIHQRSCTAEKPFASPLRSQQGKRFAG